MGRHFQIDRNIRYQMYNILYNILYIVKWLTKHIARIAVKLLSHQKAIEHDKNS